MTRLRWRLGFGSVAGVCLALPLMAQDTYSRSQVMQSVNGAFATAAAGGFSAARAELQRELAACGADANRRECRVLVTSALGALFQQQASVDKQYRDSLYLVAVRYYDQILAEVPNEPEAIYGKALAFRSIGPHEWQEQFFAQASTLDPSRAALYLTFKGDYYASARRWSAAASAYEAAAQQDADNDGARSGLVDALAALGETKMPELLARGREWEVRYPGSAADAYRAVLALSFAPNATPKEIADTAIVGLVRVQARNKLSVGTVPGQVRADWTPVREIRTFQQSAAAQDAVWWQRGTDRTDALALSALAGGRAAATARDYPLAERLWTSGVRLSRPTSANSLDLQRELALLYTHQPSIDPDHKKFDALEQEIFAGKMGVLASGDLEAAQRYHTTLGLIYLERGVWKSASYARGAEAQFTWALEKADNRLERGGFYQPLPELRLVLAQHFDSIGAKSDAARFYAQAVRAFLDADDIESAQSAFQRLAAIDTAVGTLRRVVRLRSDLATGTAATCTADRLGSLAGTGDPAFVSRQRFKVSGDCVKIDSARARQHAARAFALVDSANVTLVGGNDVARFERTMAALLIPFELTFRAEHLDQAPPRDGKPIRVTLPGETMPFAYTAADDDVLAARIVAALPAETRPFRLSVVGGAVSVPASARVPASVLARVRQVNGVRSVQ